MGRDQCDFALDVLEEFRGDVDELGVTETTQFCDVL